MESSKKGQQTSPEIVSVDLPAPDGWKKKFTPKQGGTPRRNEIVFISPTGEEIKNKKQLEQYIRTHPEGPSLSEFDWGSGDTPRRSARISVKAKATETPEGDKPKKRERKSSSKKGTKEEKDGEDEVLVAEEDAFTAEGKSVTDVEMKEAGNVADGAKEVGVSTEAAVNEGAANEDSENKTKGDIEEKTEELLEKQEGPEVFKVDPDASVLETGKEREKEEEKSENKKADVEMKEAENVADEAKEVGVSTEAAVNEGAAEQESMDKTKGNVEEKTGELLEKQEGPEEAIKVDPDASVLETGKEREEEEEKSENEKPDVEMNEAENVADEAKEVGVSTEAAVNEGAAEQDSSDKSKGNVEEKTEELLEKQEDPEEARKVVPDAPVSETEKQIEEEKLENEKPEILVVLPATSDPKEEVPTGKAIKDERGSARECEPQGDQEG